MLKIDCTRPVPNNMGCLIRMSTHRMGVEQSRVSESHFEGEEVPYRLSVHVIAPLITGKGLHRVAENGSISK
jgi:hypothetical protein